MAPLIRISLSKHSAVYSIIDCKCVYNRNYLETYSNIIFTARSKAQTEPSLHGTSYWAEELGRCVQVVGTRGRVSKLYAIASMVHIYLVAIFLPQTLGPRIKSSQYDML